MVCSKPSPHSPNIEFGLFRTPVYCWYIMTQHGKGLTSCTTMCSLTPASPLLVFLATHLVPTNRRTPIMTVFGLPIVTGLLHFLVRYRFYHQDVLVKQLVYNMFISPNLSPAVCLPVCTVLCLCFA